MLGSLDRRRRIWAVDDSATDAERVRQILSSEHDVEVFDNGATVLERLSTGETPDLMLLDWLMPEISGIEVCEYIRTSSTKLAYMPIILLTAQHGPQEIIQAFRSGASDYLVKPFVEEELKARVRALIHVRRLWERAEEAEINLRSLLTQAPDPIFAIDAQSKITFVNNEGLRALGLPKEAVIGDVITKLVPDISKRNIQTGPGESLLPLPDVRIRQRVFSPSVRILPSDSAATTTIALRDVTEQRRAEERRLDFYSVIAHDLRTPVSSILMRVQWALRGKHGVLPSGLIAELRKIESNLRSLIGMVNDFLELAKLEGAGYKIERRPVNIAELIFTAMEDFKPLLEKNKLVWKHLGLEKNAMTLGDRERLAQVLNNLVGNAIKFTPPEGVITTAVISTGEHVEVSVEDTGRGIAKEDMPNLFERYTRATRTSADTQGTGLGLMIVREIVEAHGGVIGAESEIGLGSRFWFRLPLYEHSTCIEASPVTT
ncbi:MAG: ATP-binding protein [Bdellovibrionales bacterium]